MTKETIIQSIDGGGTRGILPSAILSYLESRLRAKEGNHVHLFNYFNLLAGTDIGRILKRNLHLEGFEILQGHKIITSINESLKM